MKYEDCEVRFWFHCTPTDESREQENPGEN